MTEAFDGIFYGFDKAVATFIQSLATVFPAMQGVFDAIFLFFTLFGEELVVLLVIASVYWCIDKKKGEFLIMSLLVSLAANEIIKDSVRRLRPFLNERFSDLRYVKNDGFIANTVELKDSFSFPSGHSQCAVALYGGLAVSYKKKAVTIVGIIAIFAVMLSRVYLGVHYATDVIVGAILSLLITLLLYYLLNKFYEKRFYIIAAAALVQVPFLFLNPSSDTVKTAAITFGVLIGIFCENKFIGYGTDVKISFKILRMVIGLTLLGAVKFGFKALLPSGLISSGITYFLIGVIAMFFVPLIFTTIEKAGVKKTK